MSSHHESILREPLVTGENITTKAQAGEICDAEKDFTTCAEIGKKYSLYNKEEVKQVNSVINTLTITPSRKPITRN